MKNAALDFKMIMLILKRSNLSRLSFAGLIVVALLGSYLAYGSVFGNKGNTAVVRRGDITSSVLTSGPVQPDNRVDVKAPVSGRAETVYVKMGEKIEKGQVLLMMSSFERAAVLDAARMKDRFEAERWEKSIPQTPVVSPVSGVVIQRNIEPGQGFSEADPIMVVADRLIIETPIDETDLGLIEVGMRAEITLDAYPNDVMSGAVSSVAFDAVQVNGITTYRLRVAFDGTPEFVRVGMTANIKIDLESKRDILVIPTAALKTEDDKFYVLIPKLFGQEPEKRFIRTGLNDGKKVEILEGLHDNEHVLIPQKGAKPEKAKTFESMAL